MKINKLTIIISLSVVITTFAITSMFILRSLAENRTIDGISIGNIGVGGMTYDEASSLLEDKINEIVSGEVILKFRDEEYRTSLTELGVEFDLYKTIENVYEYSYGANIFDHLGHRIHALKSGININPSVKIDKNYLEIQIKKLIPSIKEANEASIIINDDLTVQTQPHEDGIRVDFDDIYDQMKASLINLKFDKVNIEDEKIVPEYKDENATEDAEIVTALLSKELVFIYEEGGERIYEKLLSIQPDWFNVKFSKISFNRGNIANFISNSIANDINIEFSNALIKNLPEENSDYALVEGLARNGKNLNINNTLEQILYAIENDQSEIYLKVDLIEAKVINESGEDLGELVLLGQGRSNFAGSPEGRSFNIAKGLNEKFNNILLKPGQSFSYNSYLGPVTYGNGWKASLAIFGGQDLIAVPGGGLCQVSTTMYRALVNAGLNITRKSNHSLYVHYYKKYGDGLDAAIYPGSKDLTFENDTDSYLFLQAYVDGDDAYIDIYGTPDGRRIELIGPIYLNKIPEGYEGEVRSNWNQIKWIQKIIRPGGEVEENILTSTYRTAPR